MVKISFILLFLLWGVSVCSFGQRVARPDSILLSGVVINSHTSEVMLDVTCRYGEARGTVSDEAGCFQLKVRKRDTLLFTSIGFKPYSMVVPDSLAGQEFMVGIFMSLDTLELSEVLILKRWDDSWHQNMVIARNNMAGILRQAYAPVRSMDAGMNQKMSINEHARSIEMKGMVDVKAGIGTESLEAYKWLKLQKRLKEKKEWLRPEEIDLLKKLFYLEKRKKKDN